MRIHEDQEPCFYTANEVKLQSAMENIGYLVEREGGGAAGGDVVRGGRGAAPLLPPPGGGDGALHSTSELHFIITD